MGKVSKGSKAAADGPPKEQFQLKYLRFSCNDLARTKEFYVTLGMSVEWQLRSSKTPLNTQTPATPNVPPTADATKDPEKRRPSLVQKIQQISANKKAAQDAAAKKAADELAGILTAAPVEEVKPQPQPEPPAGSPNVFKTDLCMSFSITPSNSTEHPDPTQFQLIFSNISTHKPSSQSNSRTNSRVNSRNNSAINRSINFNFGVEDKKENKKKERNQEYLVIYVHLLPRLVKRLAQKGFVCSLPITPFQGAQIAILQDPNGIEVRLIELTEAQSEDPNVLVKRQWFARVGYYTIPSVKLDHTSRYYERMFSYIGAPVAPAAGPGGIPAPPVKKEKKKKGMAAEAGTHANTAGVRLIDSEEYVVGLTKTQFLWFGNEPRSVGTSICFTGKVIAESQEARQMDRSDSLLMGIGIEVPSLDGLLKRWEWERPNEVLWEPGRIRIPGIGQYQRFKDPNNELHLEIFTPKTIDPAEAAKEAAALAAKELAVKEATMAAKSGKATPHRRGDEDVFKELEREPEINKDHLGGLSKTLSEGAIQVPPLAEITSVTNPAEVAEEERRSSPEKVLPIPQTIKVKMQKLENDAAKFDDVEELVDESRAAEKLSPTDRPKSRSAKF